MKIDKSWLRKALQDIATFGQMGFSIVVPPVLLCFFANLIVKKAGVGRWIIVVALIIGLLCSFVSVYKICMFFLYKNTRETDKNVGISYRKHS